MSEYRIYAIKKVDISDGENVIKNVVVACREMGKDEHILRHGDFEIEIELKGDGELTLNLGSVESGRKDEVRLCLMTEKEELTDDKWNGVNTISFQVEEYMDFPIISLPTDEDEVTADIVCMSYLPKMFKTIEYVKPSSP